MSRRRAAASVRRAVARGGCARLRLKAPARQPSLAARAKAGAAEGIRTPDPRITNAVLYRLSYRGKRPILAIRT